jgi:hypothetical protein
MAANHGGQGSQEALASPAPPPSADREPSPQASDPPVARKGRRHPAVRWMVHGVLLVALAAGYSVCCRALAGWRGTPQACGTPARPS